MLTPLVTIARDVVVPGLGATVAALFGRWADEGAGGIERYAGPDAPTPFNDTGPGREREQQTQAVDKAEVSG